MAATTATRPAESTPPADTRTATASPAPPALERGRSTPETTAPALAIPVQTRKRAAAAGGTLVALLALSHGANDVVSGMLGALLPTLQHRFGLTEAALALLVATLSFSASLTQPLFGGLADRLGRRRVAAAGTIVCAAFLSLLGVVPNLPLLFAVLLLGGLGSAAFHPAGASLARSAGASRRALAVSAYSAGGTAGVAIAPVAALAVVSSLGPGGTPWLMVPAVLFGAALPLVVPADGASGELGDSGRAAFSPPYEIRARRRHRPLALLRRAFAPGLLAGPVGLLSLAELLASIPFVTFSSAIPLWLVSERGVASDGPLLGATLATFSLAAAVGGLAAGALSAHVSPAALAGGTRLLAPVPLFAVFTLEPGGAPYFVAVALAGALLASALPVLVVGAQDLAPRSAATASGMLMGFASGAAGVLYAGVGHLQEAIGLQPAMAVAYLGVIPGAVLAWAVLRRHRAESDADARADLAERAAVALSCACSQCVCGEVCCPVAGGVG